MQAFVFVECGLGNDTAVKEQLQELPGIEVHQVGSIYDLVLKVEASDEARLRAILAEIKHAPGVESTLTSLVYNEFVKR